ncbi:MAG: type IV secretory system conjugative DNA transfer family protein [Alphaproteobacteria bacterium]|nr:type IV secretory system conjugative DNA transfer family protein [Alphaproteobacteria bacterium]
MHRSTELNFSLWFKPFVTIVFVSGLLLAASCAQAQESVALEASPPPPVLQDLQEQLTGDTPESSDIVGLQIRNDALKEAALSYGARGGLAYRTFEIQRRLTEHEMSLGKTYDFTRLLIAAPSGLLIEPPIVSEGQRAVIVNGGGQEAAVADRVYRINRAARIVTAPRNWRLYLERDWGRVDPPPTLLLPRNDDERELWRDLVLEGWNAGISQAEEIFEADLDRMTNDFVGMVRYRELLAQGMISPPYAMHEDRGVTGGGSEMRVGDRGVAITGPSVLIPRSNTWTTAPRQ